MYNPKGNSKEKTMQSIQVSEVEPPSHLSGVVHRFLELKTENPLSHEYRFHALPDACTYIIFDQTDTNIAGITTLRTTSEEFNLGKKFHYVNIRLLPGVWQGTHEQVAYGMVDTPYKGNLPLIEINRTLTTLDSVAKQSVLSELVEWLIDENVVASNSVIEKIFQKLNTIHSVADMADISGVSPRQLQRVLKRTTGFAPHDFLKVLRLQQTLSNKYVPAYTDQSHFIHSFRRATGYTPAKYKRRFDV